MTYLFTILLSLRKIVALILSSPNKQHLDNLRRKDSLRGAETTAISVRLGNYSAAHFEGSAYTPSCFAIPMRATLADITIASA